MLKIKFVLHFHIELFEEHLKIGLKLVFSQQIHSVDKIKEHKQEFDKVLKNLYFSFLVSIFLKSCKFFIRPCNVTRSLPHPMTLLA